MKKRKGLYIVLAVLCTIFCMPCKVSAAKENVLKVQIKKGATAENIQQALDQAKEIKKNGYGSLVVTLSPGSYRLDSDLVIYSNTTLQAEDCTLFKNHQKGPILRNYLYDKEAGTNYAHDIAVIGGIWNGGAGMAQQSGEETFRFIHAKRITVKELTIKNIVAGHLLTLAGVEDAVVEKCTFSDFTTYGTGKEAVHLDLVHSSLMVPVVKSSESRIVYDDAPCKKIKVRNCVFRNVPAGVGSHSSVRGVYQEDIEIEGNEFVNIETAAIRCYNYKDTTISENEITQAGIGIQIYTATTTSELEDDNKTSYHIPHKGVKKTPLPKQNDYHITITKNRIKDIYKGAEKKYGNAIYIFGCKKRPIGHLVIQENIISNTKNTGIRLKYAPDATVEANMIENKKGGYYRGGIDVVCSDYIKLKNNILSNSQMGISINHSSKGTYQNNAILGATYHGIYVNETSMGNTISQNTIRNTKSAPICIEGKDNIEQDN